jgi:hypothetical protein
MQRDSLDMDITVYQVWGMEWKVKLSCIFVSECYNSNCLKIYKKKNKWMQEWDLMPRTRSSTLPNQYKSDLIPIGHILQMYFIK